MPNLPDASHPGFLQKARLWAGLRLQYLINRFLRGRREVAVSPMGIPVRLAISAGREIKRAGDIHKESDLVRRLTDYLEPGDVVFDIGANIGVISLLVANHPAGGDVILHCFEPEPRNFAQLRRNAALNGLEDRLFPRRLALGAKLAKAALFVRGTAGEGRHSLVAAGGAQRRIDVEVTTTHLYCHRKQVYPNLVKIDVEGAEGEVLAGMSPLLRNHPPRDIMMEIHDKGGRDKMPDGTTIDAFLTAHGFTCVWVHHRGTSRHVHYRRSQPPAAAA